MTTVSAAPTLTVAPTRTRGCDVATGSGNEFASLLAALEQPAEQVTPETPPLERATVEAVPPPAAGLSQLGLAADVAVPMTPTGQATDAPALVPAGPASSDAVATAVIPAGVGTAAERTGGLSPTGPVLLPAAVATAPLDATPDSSAVLSASVAPQAGSSAADPVLAPSVTGGPVMTTDTAPAEPGAEVTLTSGADRVAAAEADGSAAHLDLKPADAKPEAIPVGTRPDAPAEPPADAPAEAGPTAVVTEPAATPLPVTITAPPAELAMGTTPELRLTTEASAAATVPRAVPEPPAAQLTQLVAPVLEGPDGAYTLSLQLYPEELGAVQVEVSLRAGEITLALHASRDTSLEVLRAALPELRAQLEQAGLTASSLTVDGERSAAGQGQRGSEQRPPARQQPAPSPLTASDVPAGRLDLNAPLDLRM